MARIMTAERVSCIYALLTAVSYVMHDVTKVAHKLFADIGILVYIYTTFRCELWLYRLTS